MRRVRDKEAFGRESAEHFSKPLATFHERVKCRGRLYGAAVAHGRHLAYQYLLGLFPVWSLRGWLLSRGKPQPGHHGRLTPMWRDSMQDTPGACPVESGAPELVRKEVAATAHHMWEEFSEARLDSWSCTQCLPPESCLHLGLKVTFSWISVPCPQKIGSPCFVENPILIRILVWCGL